MNENGNDDGGIPPNQAFDQLAIFADYVNGLKNMLTNNGWSEENAQAIIVHVLLTSGE